MTLRLYYIGQTLFVFHFHMFSSKDNLLRGDSEGDQYSTLYIPKLNEYVFHLGLQLY